MIKAVPAAVTSTYKEEKVNHVTYRKCFFNNNNNNMKFLMKTRHQTDIIN